MNYATIDKELLCVVALLWEFYSMLLGAEFHFPTDHKNILNFGDSSQQRLCWISYIDEYGPELHYVEGSCNVIADNTQLSTKSFVYVFQQETEEKTCKTQKKQIEKHCQRRRQEPW